MQPLGSIQIHEQQTNDERQRVRVEFDFGSDLAQFDRVPSRRPKRTISFRTKHDTNMSSQAVPALAVESVTVILQSSSSSHCQMNDLDWDLLSSYAGLLSLASASIYAGSFGSLPAGTPLRLRRLVFSP